MSEPNPIKEKMLEAVELYKKRINEKPELLEAIETMRHNMYNVFIEKMIDEEYNKTK